MSKICDTHNVFEYHDNDRTNRSLFFAAAFSILLKCPVKLKTKRYNKLFPAQKAPIKRDPSYITIMLFAVFLDVIISQIDISMMIKQQYML